MHLALDLLLQPLRPFREDLLNVGLHLPRVGIDDLKLLRRRSLLRTFGLLLITLLPFLVFLLLFSVFAAGAFGLYGFLAVSLLPRVPVAILLVGLAVVLLGTAGAFFIGIYRLLFPPRPDVFGIDLRPEDQPEIWATATEVAKNVGTPPADRIVLTPEPGISVHLSGSLIATLLGGGRRVLQIGVPSLHELTVSELRAILAHESGHFRNRDTQWSTFTYALGNGVAAALVFQT
jgi:Zn-dependent protease with chaperone function